MKVMMKKQVAPQSLALLAVGLAACPAEENLKSHNSTLPRSAVAARAQPAAPKELVEAIRKRRRQGNVVYVAPQAKELEDFQTWLRSYVAPTLPADSKRPGLPEGFALTKLDPSPFIMIEESGTARGAGVYALNQQPARRWTIEIPHSYFDQHTLQLGLALFAGLEAQALLVNTVHRAGSKRTAHHKALARSGKSPSDVAHVKASFFQAAHRALATQPPDRLAVQLHGFTNAKAPGVDIIVSAAGTPTRVRELELALHDAFPHYRTRLYPDGVSVLGGTTNAQAQASRAAGCPFVHLELSARLREALSQDPSLLSRFVGAVGQGLNHYR